MESKFKLVYNGQEVQQSDLNLLGDVAALADDRVLAEFFRVDPYAGATVSKGIIPTAVSTKGTGVNQINRLVAGNGATGQVVVYPFRAVVGSRTASTSSGKDNLRDIRSAILVNTGASLGTTVTFTAPSASNFRVDLIYAAVAVDVDDTSVTRKVKNPTTGVVSSSSVSIVTKTTVTIAVSQGTQSITNPTLPTLPSDAAGIYYIPIAYVRLKSTYSGTTSFVGADIAVVAPFLHVASSTGGVASSVAEQNRSISSHVLTNWKISNASTYAPHTAFTGDMTGGHTLWVYIDDTFANGDYVDTRVFAQRYFTASVAAGITSIQPAHLYTLSLDSGSFPRMNPAAVGLENGSVLTFMGHTFATTNSYATNRTIFSLRYPNVADMTNDGGASYLKLKQTNSGLIVERGGTTAGLCVLACIQFSGLFHFSSTT